MKEFKRIALFLSFLIVGYGGIFAQSIEFSAKASKQTVAADEAFRLIYTVNVESGFTAPDLKDFKVLSGPSQSTSSQITIINGQMKNNFSSSFSLTVRPKKEGEFTIGPASIVYNGKVYKSNSIKVTVTAASGNGQVDNSQQGNTNNKAANKYMFASISVSKTNVYKGEPVMVTYKLYSRSSQIQDYEINLGTQKDVWSQELTNNKQPWPAYQENVNGIQYVVFPLRKELVFPQKSGKLKLEPFDMMAVVRVSFFESSRFDVVSNSPVIEVMDTPPGAPASYNNAVGKYTIESSLNKEEVNVNDGIDLTFKIKGSNGNIKLIEPAKFQFPGDFEIYDPEVKDKTTVTANGMSGTKEYKYLVIPRHSGNFTIDPIEFSYFDLETKKYVVLKTPSYKIKVNKSANGEEEEGGVLSNSKEDVKILDKEIHYLKSDYENVEKGSSFFTGSGLYYSLISFPPILFFLFVFVMKRKQTSVDPNAEKEKKANKVVAKQLLKVQQLLKENKTNDFYTELLTGIQNYYCDKFSLQMVDFNRQRINEVLISKGVSETTAKRFIGLVENCEMARYASVMQGNEVQNFDEASAIINQLEKEVKA